MSAYFRLTFLTALLALELPAADRSWTGAGNGAWSDPLNWSGGVPGVADAAIFSNAVSADVTINMNAPDQPIRSLRFQGETAPWTRIFAGDGLTLDLLEMDAGDAQVSGLWHFATRVYNLLGNVSGQRARLDVASGGRLVMTNGASIYIGNGSGMQGQLFVREGAEVIFREPAATASGLYVGRETGSVGAVVQFGGRVEENTSFIPGYRGHGVYELLGGEFYHPYGNSQTRYRIGMNGQGLFYQRGGSYTASSSGGYPMEIAQNTTSGLNAFGLLYFDGGVATLNSEVKMLNPGLTAGSGSYAELTVAGTGSVTVRNNTYLTLGATSYAKGRAVVNLNGQGALRAASVRKGSTAQNSAVLNFDGGTFEASHSGDRTYFDSLTDVVVYEGGANLRSSTGRIVLDAASRLRTAQGSGVSGLTLAAGGSDFSAPPIVTLSGGGGSNATAVAFIDYGSGSVTGLAVTCRGEGYASEPAVAFAGGAGSGASASSAIAANVAGPLAFQGPYEVLVNRLATFDGEVQACGDRLLLSSRNDPAPGLPLISAVRVNGGEVQVGSAGETNDCPYDDMINPAAALIFGGDNGNGEYVQPCGPEGNPHTQHFAALQANTGIGRISTAANSTGAGRSAELLCSAFDREAGGVLACGDDSLTNMVIKSGAAHLFGTAQPVLAGVYANASDFMTVSGEGAWTKLEAYADDDFSSDANYRMTVAGRTNAVTGLAVNSMRLIDAAALTLGDAGTTVVESGMVAVGGGSAGSLLDGGTLSSGNGRDLIVFDAHTGRERRNTSAANWSLRIGSLIADNGASPVALVAVGPANVSSLMLSSGGVTVLTQATNDYSGGTYIVDAALEAAEDRSLGTIPAAPATNIVTAGMALLRAKKNAWPLALHANRGICMRGGCLALIGDDNNQVGDEIVVVNGPISGRGALVANHWAGGGVGSVVTLNGDNRAFEGTYVVHGILRADEGLGLSARANLALCEQNDTAVGTRAGGILETSGTFTRAPGTGAGQVQWSRANDIYPNLVGSNDPALSGGFAAFGGPLTVNMGGDRRTLTLGQDGFEPTVLRLQSDTATDDLTWENPVDLAGYKNISVQVARLSTVKRVFWRGAISNSSATIRSVTLRQNGKLILCDGADVGTNLIVDIDSSLQCLITNRQVLACDFRGNGPLTKWGDGVTVTTGNSTNTGDMRVYGGAWYVNGAHTLAGTYTVSNTAALGGIGLIVPRDGKTVTVNGTLLPGADEGVCGTLTLGSEEQAASVVLNGALSADISLTANDCVAVNGDVTLGAEVTVNVAAQDTDVWQTRRHEALPILTWTGTKTGTFASATALPTGWKVREVPGQVIVSYESPGTLIKLW